MNLTNAFKLFMDGANALAKVSANGFKVDRKYYESLNL